MPKRPFTQLFISYEQNAERISSTVRGDGAACACEMYLIKGSRLLNKFDALIVYSLVTTCVSYEDMFLFNITCVTESFLYVCLKYL